MINTLSSTFILSLVVFALLFLTGKDAAPRYLSNTVYEEPLFINNNPLQDSTETTPARVTVDFSQPSEEYIRAEDYQCWTSRYLHTSEQNQLLEDMGPVSIRRVWIRMELFYDLETKETDYNYDFMGFRLYDYLKMAERNTDTLLLCVAKEYDFQEGQIGKEEFQIVLENALAHYLTKFPKIHLVEVLNERDMHFKENPSGYYEYYQVFYRALQSAQQQLHPRRAVKLGGPVAHRFHDTFIPAFLELYAADTASSKQLDFVSYHQYLYREGYDNPAQVANEKETMQTWLRQNGLNENTPIYVTETGVFPTTTGTEFLEKDYVSQAAAVASLDYYYLKQGLGIHPFHWTTIHVKNSRKNQLVEGKNELTPYGNMMKMQSMLEPALIAAEAQPRDERGIGVYCLPTLSDSSITMMIWNYQYTNYDSATAYSVALSMENIPQQFLNTELNYQRYLIDEHHANYATGNAKLAMVENGSVRMVKQQHQLSFDLNTNGITLLT